ncbi:MAG: ribonuclease HI [Thermodesulfobacteria bacterium]|nr:ribonuclease HI [Thermodesulfobacteriota bacterium]
MAKQTSLKLEDRSKVIEVFTDGCCLGNPGPGAWACLIKLNGKPVVLSGGESLTTNNRMELQAVISALSYFKTPKKLIVYTDSNYLLKGITEWLPNWKKRGFKTSEGKKVKNIDLWIKLDELNKFHEVVWKKVKAHSGIKENEFVDKLAKNTAQKIKTRDKR